MTEHSAVIFVFFFLAEYASILLMCILTSLLFLGGYLYKHTSIIDIFEVFNINNPIMEYKISYITESSNNLTYGNSVIKLLKSLLYALSIGLKSCIMVFVFIWVRASFPRIRYDQLMSYCWTILLPILVALLITMPCLLNGFEIMAIGGYLL